MSIVDRSHIILADRIEPVMLVWTRGLFVSNGSFSEEGLIAFGRGKRLICMDSLDLHDMLDRDLALDHFHGCKFRRAAETGLPFLRVRDNFSN
jgi:hypothetical protein